jgi:carboxylesterase
MEINFNLFTGAEHQPFFFQGEENAALLVHGFPGTPAEMRPLGEAFSAAGWTAQGLLLPGFGAQFATLAERKMVEWVSAIEAALDELQRTHHRVVLVGYSMGGGLSLSVASRHSLDGLVLLAPLSQARGWFWTLLPVFKVVFPTIKPFRIFKVDLSQAEARGAMENLVPGADLDDPRVRAALLDFKFPVSTLGELRQVGREATQAAGKVNAPTIIIQGEKDPLVPPAVTRRLLQKLPGPLCYRELPTGHDLIKPGHPTWPAIRTAVIDFALSLE